MPKSVSFQTAPKKLAAIDRLAKARDCDRSDVINEAIDSYLDGQEWQADYIKEAVVEADAGGPFIAHADVAAWAKTLGTGEVAPDPEPTIALGSKRRRTAT